jgi:hypothetical protein
VCGFCALSLSGRLSVIVATCSLRLSSKPASGGTTSVLDGSVAVSATSPCS